MTIELIGSWNTGYALDLYTTHSEFLGENEHGHAMFKNYYTEIGKLLHDLKYKQNPNAVASIMSMIEENVKIKDFDILIPIPPSNKDRGIQPVELIAKAISDKYSIELAEDILINNGNNQIKQVTDKDKRKELLKEKFTISSDSDIVDKKILIFDDVYRSGATLRIATDLIRDKLNVKYIAVLTLTKTRKS